MKHRHFYEKYTCVVDTDNPEPFNNLELELYCYLHNWSPEQGGLGPAAHFRKIAEILWGPKSPEPFNWNPWAERMNEVVHQNPVTKQIRPNCAFSGCATSGKSHFFGLYAVVNWLCDPVNTYVFITSTSIPEAKHRVWKSVSKLFTAVPKLPGKMVDSLAKMVTTIPGKRHSDSAGVFVIAAAPNKARESVAKLIGRKNKRVIFIADELPELSPAILEGAFGNLMANPFFQFIAAGNFKSREDPFGELIEPKDGWDSIDVNSVEWEAAKFGSYVVRFDGMRSPNVLAGKNIYKEIYGLKEYSEHKSNFGERTQMFWRMCRSFETPIGLDDTLYSEADFIAGESYTSPEWSGGPKRRVSAMDPSFTNGGDRCVQMFGWHGQDMDGNWVLCFDKYKLLREDVTQKGVNRDYQIAFQFRDNCIAEGVHPENAALDATGAGAVLWSIIAEEWSYKVLKVEFWGDPSELLANVSDDKTGKQSFDRRVSELWGIGRQYVRSKQIRGLSKDVTREMKARKYDTCKGMYGAKIKVETKAEMKERIGFSPDLGDCFFVMLDLARQRFGFRPTGLPSSVPKPRQSFMELARKTDRVYAQLYSGE